MILDDALKTTLNRIKNLEQTLIKDLAIMVKDDSVSNFDKKSFGGVSWIPDKNSSSKKTLQKTGRLLNDVRNSVQNGYKIGNDKYALVVDTPYAGYHQEGTDKIPQREFIGVTDELDKQITTEITKIFDKAFKI